MTKKFFSCILALVLVLTGYSVAAYAAPSYVSAAYDFGSNGLDKPGFYYYIRLTADVTDTGEDFSVVVNGADVFAADAGSAGLIDAAVPEACIHIERGELLEIVLIQNEDTQQLFPVQYIRTCTLKGLVFADGKQHNVTVSEGDFKDGGNLWDIWMSVKRKGLFAEGDLDEFYVSLGSEWKLNVKDAEYMQDTYIADHASFTAEGIEMPKNGDTYTFPALGDGTVTLRLAGCISRTWNLHVMDKKEMKTQMLQALRAQGGFWQMVLGTAYMFSLSFGIFFAPSWLITLPAAFVYVVYHLYIETLFA